MANDLGSVIKQARKARNKTQKDVADLFGITRPAVGQWESDDTQPSIERLRVIADFLGFDFAAATAGKLVLTQSDAVAPPAGLQSNVQRSEGSSAVDISRFLGPRNVPVLGTASGGDGGDFRFNGTTIDHAPRPPGIENRRDVYVVYVVGDSVSPKYEDGDPIYVDPHRRPIARDYVLVELRGESDGEAGDAFVKRLVRRSGGKLVVEQHTPPKELVFDDADVAQVHRVIPLRELIGI